MLTQSLPTVLAKLLGPLPAELRLDAPAPKAGLPAGFVHPPERDLDALIDPAEASGPPMPIEAPGAPFRLARTANRPMVFIYEPGGPYTVLRGTVYETGSDDRLLVINSSHEPVTVREDRWLLDLDRGHAQAWLLAPEEGPRLSPPPQGDPGLAVPDWPGTQSFLGTLTSPPWLLRRAELLSASVDPLDLLCAVGLLIRLWSPTSAEDRRAALQAAMAGDPPIAARARTWLIQVPDWDGVRAAILDRAADLLERLQDLPLLAEQDRALAQAAAGRFLADRDDLASLQASLLTAGHDGAVLLHALEDLDRAVVDHSALLSDLLVLDVDDPWLRAIGRAEPEHWWGALVR